MQKEHREEGRGGGLGGELGTMVPTHRRRKGPGPGRFSGVWQRIRRAIGKRCGFVQFAGHIGPEVGGNGGGCSFFTGKSSEKRGSDLPWAGKQTKWERSGVFWG